MLLIDEIDRADSEFEAFLLEFLSDFQVTIPEVGTVRAVVPPVVVLTSNRTRELHDALKRRCLYHWIPYPGRRPRARDHPGQGCPVSTNGAPGGWSTPSTRSGISHPSKRPGIAESIAWARGVQLLSNEG